MSTESYTVCNVPNGTMTRLEISDTLARAIVAEYGGKGWRVCQMGKVIVLHTAPEICDCGGSGQYIGGGICPDCKGTGAFRYAANREIECPKCAEEPGELSRIVAMQARNLVDAWNDHNLTRSDYTRLCDAVACWEGVYLKTEGGK